MTAPDLFLQQALEEACQQGHLAAIEQMLDAGAHINAPTKYGFPSVLHVAAAANQLGAAALLIDRGAWLNHCQDDKNQLTELHRAIMAHAPQMVELLLAKGSDAHALAVGGQSTLHLCCQSCTRPEDVAILRLLVDAGVDRDGIDERGRAPLHRLYEMNKDKHEHLQAQTWVMQATEIFLQAGANVHARLPDGTGLMHLVSDSHSVDVARALLAHGAAWDQANHLGLAPIHVAAQAGCSPMLELIRSSGQPPDVPDGQGNTPLHHTQMALRTDSVPLVKCLARAGARIDEKNHRGVRPVQLAAMHGHASVPVLLALGACPAGVCSPKLGLEALLCAPALVSAMHTRDPEILAWHFQCPGPPDAHALVQARSLGKRKGMGVMKAAMDAHLARQAIDAVLLADPPRASVACQSCKP